MSHNAALRNITTSGALLEATLSPDMRVVRVACLTLPDGGPELTGLVRHITQMTDSPTGDRWLLGVEFVSATTDDRRAIEAFIEGWTKRGPLLTD